MDGKRRREEGGGRPGEWDSPLTSPGIWLALSWLRTSLKSLLPTRGSSAFSLHSPTSSAQRALRGPIAGPTAGPGLLLGRAASAPFLGLLRWELRGDVSGCPCPQVEGGEGLLLAPESRTPHSSAHGPCPPPLRGCLSPGPAPLIPQSQPALGEHSEGDLAVGVRLWRLLYDN